MNTETIKFRAQAGMALVFSLMLLLILTVLGITSMSGTLMQERMAGNVNLQTLAFEAASAGVPDSLEWGLDTDNWNGNGACTRGGGEWVTPWSPFTAVNVPNLPDGIVVEYQRRIGCFEPDDIPDHWQDSGFSIPTQLLVLNQGRVRRGNEVLATREVEVRIENRGGESQCAISIYGGLDPDGVNAANGNFQVDGGEGGCPISISKGSGIDALLDSIVEDKEGQYQPNPPGIQETEGHAPWNNAEEFATTVNQIKTAVLAYQEWNEYWRDIDFDDPSQWNPANPYWPEDCPDPCPPPEEWPGKPGYNGDESSIPFCESTFYAGNTRPGNQGVGNCNIPNLPGGNNAWENSGNSVPSFGADAEDLLDGLHITYIAGHVGLGGNQDVSGIVIAEGGACWSGTASFTGMKMMLGGHYQMSGGGSAQGQGHTVGALTLTKLIDRYPYSDLEGLDFQDMSSEDLMRMPYDPPSTQFDLNDLWFSGGGGHAIDFKCEADDDGPGFTQAIERLNNCLQLEEPLEPNCDPDGFGLRKAIASWREYVDRQRWPDN